jgi:dipeptidyl aminopeptidase/acylaminoacyl peptidase
LAEDERKTSLYWGDVATGDIRQLSFNNETTGSLAWRPDGSVSFTREHDGLTQVWINPLDGSEPRPITAMETDVVSYWWSPDGQSLVVKSVPPVAAQDSSATADREDWTVYDRLEHPAKYEQLWLVAATDAARDFETRQLTQAPLHPYGLDWSPDGKTLAVTYNARFSSLIDEEQQIGLLDLETGEMETITDPRRHSSRAAFSPDGKQLAYFTDREKEFRAYYNLKDLVVRDLKSGDTRALTGEADFNLGGYGSLPSTDPFWSEDGKMIHIMGAEGTNLDLYQVDVKRGGIERATDLDGSMVDVHLANGRYAYVETALDLPGTLYAGDIAGNVKAIASVNESVAAYNLYPPQKLTLPGHDGLMVEGFLFLPPGANDDENLPAIIEMHGGPVSRYGNAWSSRYPWQVLAKNGFAVFIVNPRGGTAYGIEFQRGVHRNFGTNDYKDIMAAVDALVERGTIDSDRLGFTGYSYGGMMTNVVISRTDRFKAAVSIAGMWNYTSAIGQNNSQLFIDSYDQPWSHDLQLLWEQSPVSRADKIVTPTLVMHGLDDEPVDPRQSVEMFSYLQLNGVDSRLVLYPDEGHGINKPSHMLDYQTRELQWFRHYVLGDKGAIGAEKAVPVE